MSQFEPELLSPTDSFRLKTFLSSLMIPGFGTYKLISIIWFIICLISMQGLILKNSNDFAVIGGGFVYFIQLHYLILISSKSFAARCSNFWAGVVRMLGRRSAMLNLIAVTLLSSEVSMKFKIFMGLIAAMNEIVYVLWPLIPTQARLAEIWNEYSSILMALSLTGFIGLPLLSVIFFPSHSLSALSMKILVPLMISFPYINLVEGPLKCHNENCNCRAVSPLPITSPSQISNEESEFFLLKSVSHEKQKLLREEMSFWPALVSFVFSLTVLPSLHMAAGLAVEDSFGGYFSQSSGTLIILLVVVIMLQQITSIKPQCLHNDVFFSRVVFMLLIGGATILVLLVFPVNENSYFGGSLGQFMFVACLLWWEAHDAYFRYYVFKDPAEWGKYAVSSFLLLNWALLLHIWE